MCYSYSIYTRNLVSSANFIEHKHHYCCTANAVEKIKCLHKTEELKEKEDKELLKLLHSNPLVSMPIDYKFSFLKQIPSNICLRIAQKVVIISNIYTLKCSIEVVTKRNDK